jgi:hypothetical protein
LRKIALIGSAQTVYLAPWYDPTWEIWAHATVHHYCRRVDRYFDLHPWEWITGKQVPGYMDFLTKCNVPIYMQRVFDKVPASVRYPRERVMAEHPRYFTSHAKGVQLVVPEGAPLLREPGWLYGYESHIGKTHVREKTGGKKPGMESPPQNLPLTEMEHPTVERLKEFGRTDCPFNADACNAMLERRPPLLPNGKPAWAYTADGQIVPA